MAPMQPRRAQTLVKHYLYSAAESPINPIVVNCGYGV